MSLSFIHPRALLLLGLLVPIVVLALAGRRQGGRRWWASLALRSTLLTLIVLALAGVQLRTRADTLTAVFVLDVSDSVPVEEQARGEALIREAVAAMPPGDRAAVVLFGQDALVERMPSEEPLLADLASVPVTARTDIARALQLAMALYPDEGARRLVLLSDGRENLGEALAQAELAAAHQIELVYQPLRAPQGEVEVLLDALQAPAEVRIGQRFELTAIVQSTAPVGATLRVFADGRLVRSTELALQAGSNRYVVPLEADEVGFRRFRAELVPDADTRLQNNAASAFTVVAGPPRVLIVEGGEGEATQLAAALRAAQMDVQVVPPAQLPAGLPELAAYDGVVLANVPRAAMPSGSMPTLQAYVRDLGRGLLMTGGENAFGAGGYLRTPLEETLPVDMDVRTKEQSPNLALVLVVDKSGSMGRCHCDNPDLNQTYERREVGQPKVDIAKEAIMRAAGALGPQDYLGVVAFDDTARWALDLQRAVDVIQLERTIGTIDARGQTNLRAGVEAAYAALDGVEARYKHVILMTDGWVREGELSGTARAHYEAGVTLSVVAAGGGSAQYLAELAAFGGGRYYPAVDILQVPDLFLKETVRAVGEYIVEEPFYPLPTGSSPVLRGLDVTHMPALLGYNGATPKDTAHILLSTPRGDPLLATWQYGLGRAAAWTSDLEARWAVEWLTWGDFARFVAQLVGWTLPAPQAEGLQVETALEGAEAVVRAEVTGEDGAPRNYLDVRAVVVGPDLQRQELSLEQVGAGQYEARLSAARPGTYLLQVSAREGEGTSSSEAPGGVAQRTAGLAVPYSPEYRSGGGGEGLLAELARLTGGGPFSESAGAFQHNLPALDRARDAWRALLLLAAALFPLDVALRRLVLGRGDVRRALVWLRAHLPLAALRPAHAAGREPVLGQLFAARERAQRRAQRPSAEGRAALGDRAVPPERATVGGEALDGTPHAQPEEVRPRPEPPRGSGEGADDAPADMLARLRRAKRRAQEDEHGERGQR
ncbi:MAG: VWA domain-containing protein [Anaerolineae bacterium]